MKYPCLFFLLSFWLPAAPAQQLSCLIADAQGEPVPYANVYNPKFETGTISDAKGVFSLDPGKPGKKAKKTSK
jgi:hypothetical protein